MVELAHEEEEMGISAQERLNILKKNYDRFCSGDFTNPYKLGTFGHAQFEGLKEVMKRYGSIPPLENFEKDTSLLL